MKTLTKTHIAQAKQHNNTIMDNVCELLNWTAEQYTQHQYETYENLLNRLFIDKPLILDGLRHSAIFRGFFINEWNERTKQDFLSYALLADSETLVLPDGSFTYQEVDTQTYDEQEYMFIHNPHSLASNPEFLSTLYQILDIIFCKKW